MYAPSKPGPLPPLGAEVLQWDQAISSQDCTSRTTQVSQAHALPVSTSLRSALLFTPALLPGPLVKTSPGITTCGSLSFFPDRFSPTHSPCQHPVPADLQGLRAFCQPCPPCFMCAPGLVFRLCEVKVLAESRHSWHLALALCIECHVGGPGMHW